MSQQIIEAIKTKIAGSGSLNTAIGGRIYHLEAPANQSLSYPYLVFTIITMPTERYFGDVTAVDMTVQIDLYGKRSDGDETLGDTNDLVIALFNGTTQAATGFDRVVFTPISLGIPSMEEDAIRIMSQWRARATDF